MKHFFFLVCMLPGVFTLMAQQELLRLHDANGLNQGQVSVVDIDGDGNADIVFSGKKGTAANSENGTYIYQGNGDGTFDYLTVDNQFPGGQKLTLLWEDFNGDGQLDLFSSGQPGNGVATGYMKQYLATEENFCFSEQDPYLPSPNRQYATGSVVADFDNDGLMDYAHIYEAQTITHLVRFQDASGDSVAFNLGTIITKSDGVTFATQINGSQLTLVDFNNDGYVDIFVTGHIAQPTPAEKYTALLVNNGDRTFTEKKFEELVAGNQATSLFADVNGDGLMDLILSGFVAVSGSNVNVPLAYYKNVSGDLKLEKSFDEMYQSKSASISGAVADINNDGYYDFVIAGLDNSSTRADKTAFYMYDPSQNEFVLNTILTDAIPGVEYAAFSVIDADNDGILDFALMGVGSDAKNLCAIYKNTTFTAANQAPSVPTDLQNTVAGSEVELSWEAATDDKTPANSLTYNIYLKNLTTGKYVIHPKASLLTGKRQVYSHGNVFLSKSKTMTLPDGEYEWSVQAVDAAYAGSSFAEIKKFKVGGGSNIEGTRQPELNLLIDGNSIIVLGQENVEQMSLFDLTGSVLGSVSNTDTLPYRVASGIYILKLKAGTFEICKKIRL